MPFLGCVSSSFLYARARHSMLPLLAAFCVACALSIRAHAQDSAPAATDPAVRIEAVQAALRAKDASAAPDFAASYAGEAVPSVRAALVRGVAALDPVRGGVLARAALTDPQPIVRLAAAESLAQSQGAASVPDLVGALAEETNAGVRHTIVFWLGSFKTAVARAALAQALAEDKDPNVRLQAARSLQRHGTTAARNALNAAKTDADKRVRAIANEP